MPPRTKFSREEIIQAAVRITRQRGFESVTAREIGAELGISSRPIFTWFDSMEQLKVAVYEDAKILYRQYLEQGLSRPIPFLGVGQQYIRFAREEPELYKVLFLTKLNEKSRGAMASLKFAQDLARDSLMKIYNLDGKTADKYFRNLWLVSFSFTTLIVTGNCPYSDEEISAIFTEMSLSLCKAYKEVPGLAEGNFDRDAVFSELVKKATAPGIRPGNRAENS